MSIALPAPLSDLAGLRRRTSGSMVASVIAHAALFAWVVLAPHPERVHEKVTEISFLEGGEAAAAAPAEARQTAPGALVAETETRHFRRESRSADVEPVPQSESSLDDRIEARLAALQNTASRPSSGATPGAPSAMWNAAPAVPGGIGSGGSAPVAMARGGGGTSPLPLVRGTGGHVSGPALAPAPAAEHSETSRPAREGESTARRTLAGATLMGPIADRAVLVHVAPEYPEWAKREAVEGSVTLYFIVRPDGTIKENVLVQKTAGFGDFDDNARNALRAWRFEPLREGRTGEQWGTITFRYRIRDGG